LGKQTQQPIDSKKRSFLTRSMASTAVLEESMTGERLKLFVAAAMGVIGAGAVALAAEPIPPVSSPARADRACAGEGMTRNTLGYEQCVSRATRAFDWGEPEMAYAIAHIAAEARASCLAEGVAPQTHRYEACVSNEMDARSQLLLTEDRLGKEDHSIAHVP
jgi:hypothetical protein